MLFCGFEHDVFFFYIIAFGGRGSCHIYVHVYYVIGGPYVSDQAGLNRGPLVQNISIVTL